MDGVHLGDTQRPTNYTPGAAGIAKSAYKNEIMPDDAFTKDLLPGETVVASVRHRATPSAVPR